MKIINKDIFEGMKDIENNSIRCIITSPPYYKVRDYGHENQIGLEETPEQYVSILTDVCRQLRPKLKEDGNLFINMGDKYGSNKSLMLIPSMFALAMIKDGWILRNKIIWYKPNHQPSPVKDRLTNTYEEIFHFTKNKQYYYDLDSVRIPFEHDYEDNEKVYQRLISKINNSDLSQSQKNQALEELKILHTSHRINKDARLKLKGSHKPLYGSNSSQSGRAKELEVKGYYFHCNNPKGRNLGDLLSVNIKSHKGTHEAVFPEELISPLIKVGSDLGDTVLDTFSGTGTTCRVAEELGRIGIGIEINSDYVEFYNSGNE